MKQIYDITFAIQFYVKRHYQSTLYLLATDGEPKNNSPVFDNYQRGFRMPSRFRVREKICKAMQGLSEQIKEHPRSSLGFKHNAQQNFAAWHRAQERKKVIRNVTVMAVSLVVVGLSWYFKDSMYSYVFTEDGELRKKRRLALMSMIPIMVAMLLASAVYSCCVKMRHRLEDDEKKSTHPLELSNKAASKKPSKKNQQAKDTEGQSKKKTIRGSERRQVLTV